MTRNKQNIDPHRRDPKGNADLINVLTDLSTVSLRIAHRLSLMEQRLSREGGRPGYATKTRHAR